MYDLAIRETHKYVGTYSHLDEWRSIGSFEQIGHKVLPRNEAEESDMCEPISEQHFVQVSIYEDEQATVKDIETALLDHFTKQGCHHEWDCCGCRSYSASQAVNLGGPIWRVDVESSRNF